MTKPELVRHPFEPVWAPDSRVLILGSLPSVLSRQQGFYYGNPQNRFWAVLGRLFDEAVPADIDGRRAFLLAHRIALWDVLAQGEISGSSDSTIQQPVANDLTTILRQSKINRVFANGQTAAKLYRDHCQPKTGLPCIALPSTSPANASFSLERLCEAWRVVREEVNR